MRIETRGSGRDIVIIHGWRLDRTVEQADLEPVFEAHPGWRRHYVDLPGMGESPPPPPGADLSTYVTLTMRAVREVVGDHTYALAGTSAGALIARAIAAVDPEQVAALMLRVPLVEPDERRRVLPSGADAVLGPQAAQWRAEKVEKLWGPAERRTHEAVEELRRDRSRYRLDLPVSRLDVPALVIAGRQDTRVGWKQAVDLLDSLPHATLAVVDAAAHEYPWPNDPLFNALVGDWLVRAAAEMEGLHPSAASGGGADA